MGSPTEEQQLEARCPHCGELMIYDVSNNDSSPVRVFSTGHKDNTYITKTEQQKQIELVEADKNIEPDKVI